MPYPAIDLALVPELRSVDAAAYARIAARASARPTTIVRFLGRLLTPSEIRVVALLTLAGWVVPFLRISGPLGAALAALLALATCASLAAIIARRPIMRRRYALLVSMAEEHAPESIEASDLARSAMMQLPECKVYPELALYPSVEHAARDLAARFNGDVEWLRPSLTTLAWMLVALVVAFTTADAILLERFELSAMDRLVLVAGLVVGVVIIWHRVSIGRARRRLFRPELRIRAAREAAPRVS